MRLETIRVRIQTVGEKLEYAGGSFALSWFAVEEGHPTCTSSETKTKRDKV